MEKNTVSSSRNELIGVIIFTLICTIIMIFLDAFEKLYIFTHTFDRFQFGEFAVFFPAFLAIGFTYFSYRRIKELESEIKKRGKAEMALRESKKKYKDLSITDDLTQLYNSRYFYKRLDAEVDRAMRYSHPLSIILLDIDDFKHFNDSYGHMEGNKVLAVLGKVIRECIRRTDTAFRYGGEEFTIILPETANDGTANVAERIRERFESESFSPKPDEVVNKTVSLGVCHYDPDEDIESLIKRADLAMYEAKKQGKNRVSFSNPTKGDGDVHKTIN